MQLNPHEPGTPGYERHERGRTIRVWAAGNHEPGSGDGHRNLNALGPLHFPELRGQHIAVTALSINEAWLAPYANPCGELPADWDASRFGKHFCLSAPGTLSEDVQGTSFAAPFVSGVLARMMKRFPDVTPRELVKKLMDTADGWREEDFDGDVYVAEVEVEVIPSGTPGEPPTETKTAVVPGYPPISVDVTGTDLGGHVVVQRGCLVSPAGYLVSTGERDDLCVVWGISDGTLEEAEAGAEGRFGHLYGAGRVDVDSDDGAFAPVSPPVLSAQGGRPAPVTSTRLRAPAAWGALGDRLSGLSLAAFDSLDFPFFYRLEDFVADGDAGGASPIPEFLPEPGGARDCGPLPRLAPGLKCISGAGGAPVRALVSPDGAGAAFRLGEGALVSGFTRQEGRLDGAGSGAFSFDGGSSLAALRLDRGWTPGESHRWRVDGSLTLAVDLPRGLGAPSPSLFAAETTLLSEWSLGVTHSSEERRTHLSLAQPARAETGHGRFTVPSGRREDGTRLYETHRVSLVPSRRELTLRLAHQRPLGGGDVVLSVHRTENRGHRPTRPEHGAGLAWRARW